MKKSVLLDQARAVRAQAERTRRLARAIDDADATKAVLGYADELEKRAARLESKARDLDADGQQELARQVYSELETARATVKEIQRTLSSPSNRKNPT